MDWTKENGKDNILLKRLDLQPIDLSLVGGDEQLVGLIEASNSQIAGFTGRFTALTDQRKRLADFSNWTAAAATEIEASLSALRRETWNLLADLRKFLLERQAIIAALFTAAGDRVSELNAQHDAIRERTCKGLNREYRKMLVATPGTAAGHFADLVDADDEVQAAFQAIAPAQAILNQVFSARQKCDLDISFVNARQREVFPVIAA